MREHVFGFLDQSGLQLHMTSIVHANMTKPPQSTEQSPNSQAWPNFSAAIGKPPETASSPLSFVMVAHGLRRQCMLQPS